jgi:hypothetical protein
MKPKQIEFRINKEKFELLKAYLPYGLLYDFKPKNDFLNGDLTESQIIKNIKLIENFNQIQFINSIKNLNEHDFIKEINKQYLAFKYNHTNEPYLTNYWLFKTNELINDNRDIEPTNKEAFKQFFHSIHFPENDNLKNWKDVKYSYTYYLDKIELNINSIDYINSLSNRFIDGEIYNICHRAKVEIENGITNKTLDTLIIENDLNKLSKRHYDLIEKHNLNHVDKMPDYRAYFDTMQYLYDYLIDFLNEINNIKNGNEKRNIESVVPENKHPEIFSNGYAYQIFIEWHKKHKTKGNHLANYSFLIQKMLSEKLIFGLKQNYYLDFLDKYEISITKIKLLSEIADKSELYLEIKQRVKTQYNWLC